MKRLHSLLNKILLGNFCHVRNALHAELHELRQVFLATKSTQPVQKLNPFLLSRCCSLSSRTVFHTRHTSRLHSFREARLVLSTNQRSSDIALEANRRGCLLLMELGQQSSRRQQTSRRTCLAEVLRMLGEGENKRNDLQLGTVAISLDVNVFQCILVHTNRFGTIAEPLQAEPQQAHLQCTQLVVFTRHTIRSHRALHLLERRVDGGCRRRLPAVALNPQPVTAAGHGRSLALGGNFVQPRLARIAHLVRGSRRRVPSSRGYRWGPSPARWH